jgi:hypothetical protein
MSHSIGDPEKCPEGKADRHHVLHGGEARTDEMGVQSVVRVEELGHSLGDCSDDLRDIRSTSWFLPEIVNGSRSHSLCRFLHAVNPCPRVARYAKTP